MDEYSNRHACSVLSAHAYANIPTVLSLGTPACALAQCAAGVDAWVLYEADIRSRSRTTFWVLSGFETLFCCKLNERLVRKWCDSLSHPVEL